MISKRNQNVTNCTRFSKDKTKLLLVPKKFENRPEQKLLDQIFLVLIENVLFRSRILFQKRIYSLFFGTKAGKRKLSILKERQFDIATNQPLKDKKGLINGADNNHPRFICTVLCVHNANTVWCIEKQKLLVFVFPNALLHSPKPMED